MVTEHPDLKVIVLKIRRDIPYLDEATIKEYEGMSPEDIWELIGVYCKDGCMSMTHPQYIDPNKEKRWAYNYVAVAPGVGCSSAFPELVGDTKGCDTSDLLSGEFVCVRTEAVDVVPSVVGDNVLGDGDGEFSQEEWPHWTKKKLEAVCPGEESETTVPDSFDKGATSDTESKSEVDLSLTMWQQSRHCIAYSTRLRSYIVTRATGRRPPCSNIPGLFRLWI